ASGGYYSSLRASRAADPAGRDYFTAPMAHPVFGYLLALQLAEVWRLLERPSPFWIVEPGCGDGLLARDVLTGLERLEPGCFAVTRYVVADRAAPHAGREVAFPGRAQRIVADGLPLRGVVGCVLSNELLDAFPVHRFQVTQNAFQEIYVTLRDGRLTDAPGAPSSEHLTHRLERLRCAAPGMAEGHRSEVCLALGGWVAEVARALERGVVLTLDYGDITPSLYGPERSSGTLQCYFRHTVSGNPYLRVGRQDITAHVDFGVLTGLGEHAGLTVLGYTTQGRFMRNLGADLFVHRMHRLSDTLPQSTIAANRMAMLELVRPESFGSFKVLAQAKGLSSASLSGFSQDNPVRERLTRLQPDLPVPLLTPDHAPLLAGKYPHLVPEPPENFTFP
ncbi:MAG: hypothetical protein FJ315_06410, partial [SAR202 cluster bacterium]|nr:hypothetical protein [SAR202 cluster bacterium]